MKILHCCLACFYIDDYSYQENILPKEHKRLGLDVQILASTETFIDNQKLGYTNPKSYRTPENIPITRLPYSKLLPKKIVRKLRLYRGVKEYLNNYKPDIIFLHDLQFLDIKYIAKYAKENPHVIIYADCHTDFENSARNWVSKNILHKLIYKRCAQRIEPHVKKFYGVLPIRSQFLHEVYKIPKEKIDLLVMGAEDELVKEARDSDVRSNLRNKLGYTCKDFVIIAGGKIDEQKNIHLLIEAITNINESNLKLLLFGNIEENLKQKISESLLHPNVQYIGWQDSKDIYKLFGASDLAVFPGTHSVLWEQAVGTGIPAVFKHWPGMNHVDVGGNCKFLYKESSKEIEEVIMNIYINLEVYNRMLEVALSKGIRKFSYENIAKRSIEFIE